MTEHKLIEQRIVTLFVYKPNKQLVAVEVFAKVYQHALSGKLLLQLDDKTKRWLQEERFTFNGANPALIEYIPIYQHESEDKGTTQT
jgi:hypothetical protein